MKRTPIVGETLYSLNVGNAARYSEQKLTPVRVVSVGRKYFECRQENRSWNTKFHLGTWTQKTEYSADECLYETPQEWEDEKEQCVLVERIRDVLGKYGAPTISLNKLRRIAEILEN